MNSEDNSHTKNQTMLHDHGEHVHKEESNEMGHGGHGAHANHANMVEDFKKRFWISLVLTIP
ncbi:MAG TPA: heavy metal translocating P-type ATPase, partial [Gammaproteobacteria bacterium]|nr:heavy metal translocating P-type ATPase [Gammaproteobacteria bacterium]